MEAENPTPRLLSLCTTHKSALPPSAPTHLTREHPSVMNFSARVPVMEEIDIRLGRRQCDRPQFERNSSFVKKLGLG